jgi:hypothetical protein
MGEELGWEGWEGWGDNWTLDGLYNYNLNDMNFDNYWGNGAGLDPIGSWGLPYSQLNNIYNTVNQGAPTWDPTTNTNSSWLSSLWGGGGSDVFKLGLSALLGSLGDKGRTPGGSTGYASTDPIISALMAKVGPQSLAMLSDILNDLGGVSQFGAMEPGTPELLKNAAMAALIDPATGQFNQSILDYIATGGGITSQEEEARSVYEAAMSPQLLQKTQDIVRQMGGGAWNSGTQAQLMQDAIARTQLDSAKDYSSFLNTQGTTLANRQAAKAGLTPNLMQAYINPLELAQPSVAAMNLPREQTRLTQKSLREQAQNAINAILGRSSPTQTTQTTQPDQSYWSKFLTGTGANLGTTGLNESLLSNLLG